MPTVKKNTLKEYPKGKPSLSTLKIQDAGNRGVGQSIYDVVTNIPGHEEAWSYMSSDQKWELLENLKGVVNSVQDLKGDDGKVSIPSALKLGYDVDLSSLQPFREGLGFDKGQFIDHLQSSIVSHISEKNKSLSLEEIESNAKNIRNKFGFLAKLKKFESGGKFKLLKK